MIKLSCEKFCLREIDLDEEFTKKLINQTLNENKSSKILKFYLSSYDFDNLTKFIQHLKDENLPKELSFEKDESLSKGGITLELPNGRVDKTIETRFQSIWDALV